jgi:hypothetical protein
MVVQQISRWLRTPKSCPFLLEGKPHQLAVYHCANTVRCTLLHGKLIRRNCSHVSCGFASTLVHARMSKFTSWVWRRFVSSSWRSLSAQAWMVIVLIAFNLMPGQNGVKPATAHCDRKGAAKGNARNKRMHGRYLEIGVMDKPNSA